MSKNKNKKSSNSEELEVIEQPVVEQFEPLSPREKRLLKHKEKNLQPLEDVNYKEEFRKFFIKIKTKNKLDGSLEEVLWLHLKAIKHDKTELFEAGIKNFGLNI